MSSNKLNIAHLTRNPALGSSLASFLGRNDAAISLALDLVRDKRQINVAILGAGVFETLTTAASKKIPKNSQISIYDNAQSVISSLQWILNNEVASPTSPTEKALQQQIRHFFENDKEKLINYFRHLGINTDLLWDDKGNFSISKNIPSRIQINSFDIINLPEKWENERCYWDLIICNNVIPNLSVKLGRSVIDTLLKCLWKHLNFGGIALIGTISSHFYPSSLHPKRLSHFPGEAAMLIQNSPYNLLGWVDRAYVREKYQKYELQDGYMYIYIGKNSLDFNEILSNKRLIYPSNISSDFCEEASFEVNDLWEQITYKHIPVALRVNKEFRTLKVSMPFPHSIKEFFANEQIRDLQLRICEKLLLPINY